MLIPKYRDICEKDDLELLEFRSRLDCLVRCRKCGDVFVTRTLGYLTEDHITKRCRHCHPIEPITGPTLFETSFCEFINTLGVKYRKNCRSIITPQEIDYYFPDYNIGIELDGIFWHCELSKPNDYHLKKTMKCAEKGVRLIHIFEDEWRDKREICMSRVKNILGLTENTLYARKCEVKEVSKNEKSLFLKENHIQGDTVSKYNYGLFSDGNLVSLMTFGGLRKNLGLAHKEGSYELLRFCNKIGTTVVGGASKLLEHFKRELKPETIISYCDLRWSDGDLYEKIGFELDHISKPNYSYVINSDRKNRFGFRKSVLVEKYGCSEDMSEHEFCLSNKWYRIYDCGNKVYKLNCCF